MNNFNLLCDIMWAWFFLLMCLGIRDIGLEFGFNYGMVALIVSVGLVYEVMRET